MAKMISISIDLKKIDKSRIKPGKNGQKYYSLTVICNDGADQYGNDTSIIEGQTKEEIAAKKPKVYLGNGRTFWRNGPDLQKPAEKPASNQAQSNDDDWGNSAPAQSNTPIEGDQLPF